MLSRIVAEAEARGDAAMELEVFGHNEPAVRLYRRHGFEQVDRLLGFEKQSSPDAVRIGGCEVVDVSHMPADAEADPFLPWQLQSATLRRLPLPWQLIDDDGAFALVDLSKDAAAQLRFLYTTPELRRQGRARRLLAAVERQAAGRPIRVAQLVPRTFEPFMRRLGFGVAEHFQWRMVWKPSKG